VNIRNEIIEPVLSEFSKGKLLSLLMSKERIEALPKISGNLFYDLSELKHGWFMSMALSKSGVEIMLLEGVLHEGKEGEEVKLRSIPFNKVIWGDLKMTHAKFLNRNIKIQKTKRKNKQGGMVGYLNKQMFGTRW